ncbi:FAD-dependent oxidoreductase [Streptomyces monticola]|uniref:FAD-dependent oxidoreductase n=1 Tax=Streptomyces monticola TaxID=2666263 RepID=A0ABW2JQK0_9ACTN
MSRGSAGTAADVLVVGAGPVGLFTAALLDAAGVRVTVLEQRTGPSEHSKGATVHPRTLEVLSALRAADGRGLGDVLADQGRRATGTHFALLPTLLDYSGLPTRYPYVLMVPQSRTELLLLEHLLSRAVPVHYGQRVEQVAQDRDGVRAHVGRAVYRARYLVGADGAHSLVRGQAGIVFPGTGPSLVTFVADARLAHPPGQAVHRWDARSGTLSVLPLPGGLHRLYGAEPRDTGLSAAQAGSRRDAELTEERLRSALRRISGTDYGLRETVWMSKVTDATHTAAQLRAGRVFLAGDAAHTHFPAGGQGLNVGLQDAANLAWKLAAECTGSAAPHIRCGPSGYHAERHPVAAALAHNTLAQTALMYTFTPAGAALRHLISDLLVHEEGAARHLAGWMSGLDVSYPAPLGAHPLAGRRLPAPELLDRLRPGRFLLALRAGSGGELACPTGLFTPEPTSRDFGAAAALVRPDGHIAHAWDHVPDRSTVLAAHAHWTGTSSVRWPTRGAAR